MRETRVFAVIIDERRFTVVRVLIYGVVTFVLGLLWPVLEQFGVSRLPGDFVAEVGLFRVTVPITSSVLVSVFVGAVLWLASR